jgi:DNA-binding winged helix-turn-helix (wHTH) protein
VARVLYRFADFALDRDTRQLMSDGAEIHLSPKAFELLAMLLACRRRAVSKAELQQHLWPSTFVEETNLASLVVEIRRALRDSASDPDFVRTVYGFGYRFVGTVTEDDGSILSGHSPTMPCLVVDNRVMILLEGANIIGRAPDASVSLDARGVSRHHARVVISQGVATLDDLGSKNGTHLNGACVTTATRLSDGDEIRLGAIILRFRVTRPLNPTETVGAGNR